LQTGASTSAYQATLESLVDTLQELAQRLAPLASIMNAGAVGMRVVGVSMPSTAVTGPITSALSIAEKAIGGISWTQRLAQENMAAVLSNINNAVGA
jgi:hypothetical protein